MWILLYCTLCIIKMTPKGTIELCCICTHIAKLKTDTTCIHSCCLLCNYVVKTFGILQSPSTALEICNFISKSLKGLLPSVFNSRFKFSLESHSYDTRWSDLGYLKISSYWTKTCDRYLMNIHEIYVWNH